MTYHPNRRTINDRRREVGKSGGKIGTTYVWGKIARTKGSRKEKSKRKVAEEASLAEERKL